MTHRVTCSKSRKSRSRNRSPTRKLSLMHAVEACATLSRHRITGCLARMLVPSVPCQATSVAKLSTHLRPAVTHPDRLMSESVGFSGRPDVCSVRPQDSRFVVYARRGSTLLRELQEGREDELVAQLPTVDKVQWSRPLKVLSYPDPRLRAQNAIITGFDDSLRELAAEMFEVLYEEENGVGLAAPQVGVNVRLMVFNPEGKRGEGEEVVLCNPRIVSTSKGQVVEEEGCLSFLLDGNFVNADVPRWNKVKIKAQDVTGKKFSMALDGWRARIFQHEYDHLEGILFPDRVSEDALGQILPKLRRLEAEYVEANPTAKIKTY